MIDNITKSNNKCAITYVKNSHCIRCCSLPKVGEVILPTNDIVYFLINHRVFVCFGIVNALILHFIELKYHIITYFNSNEYFLIIVYILVFMLHLMLDVYRPHGGKAMKTHS